MAPRVSAKAARFQESVIREMSRICTREGGVNLAQGFPDFAAPMAMKAAAKEAIDADINQYAVTWGAKPLRDAIARRTQSYNGLESDPEEEITVTCGATEAMLATFLALIDPGQEVVIFSPFYENYGPDCVLSGAVARIVPLRPPHWTFDPEELRRAVGPKTRAIVVNTPHNPTGKVFDRGELEAIAHLCREHDLIAITDEIYEYILFDDAEHISIATLPDMAERTVTISGLSKTWSATGWRVGWALAAPGLTDAIRKTHDFLTVGAAAPLQEAAAVALGFGPEYFSDLRRAYSQRRDLLVNVLQEVGFEVFVPRGAYYVMTDAASLMRPQEDDIAFSRRLVARGGVATVPASSFFRGLSDEGTGHTHSDDGRAPMGQTMIRFCFAKRTETLERAAELLRERLA